MILVIPSTTVTRRYTYGDVVTGTPTAQLVVNGTNVGSPVNGTGSGATWTFAVGIPGTVALGGTAVITATAVIAAVTVLRDLAIGTVVNPVSRAALAAEIAVSVKAELSSINISRIGPGYEPSKQRFTLVGGDQYVIGNGGHQDFSVNTSALNLVGATIEVKACSPLRGSFLGVGTLIDTNTKLRVQWPNVPAGIGLYWWQAKITDGNSKIITVIQGPLQVTQTVGSCV